MLTLTVNAPNGEKALVGVDVAMMSLTTQEGKDRLAAAVAEAVEAMAVHDIYPPLSHVKEVCPGATAAYGMECPGHGSLVVGVVGASSLAADYLWDGQPVKFVPIDGPPPASDDFGEALVL